MSHRNQAFTLLEMAIVLTIIGLIIGGIITGKNLIRAAQLQSVTSDVDRYKKAVQLFKDKYLYLPGDFPTATNFWGTNAVGCPYGGNTAPPGTATCNGNGDGFVGTSPGYLLGTNFNGKESYYMWQHLANAGFIDGSYSGNYSGALEEAPGVNTPRSSIPGATFLLLYVIPCNSGITCLDGFSANYNHVIVFGAPMTGGQFGNTAGPIAPLNPILTATEAVSLDQKMDDGFPGTGNVLSLTPTGTNSSHIVPNCATSATPPAAYKTSTTGNQCSLIFITGF